MNFELDYFNHLGYNTLIIEFIVKCIIYKGKKETFHALKELLIYHPHTIIFIYNFEVRAIINLLNYFQT